MFYPQISRSAPPGCLLAFFPGPRSHDSTLPTTSPVTLSPSVILLLSAPHHLSPFALPVYSQDVIYTLFKKKKKKSQCSAPPPLWFDVLLHLTRGWTHKCGKGQLSELQSWARHISYSLGDFLRARHQICLSSCLARTHIFTPSLTSLCCLCPSFPIALLICFFSPAFLFFLLKPFLIHPILLLLSLVLVFNSFIPFSTNTVLYCTSRPELDTEPQPPPTPAGPVSPSIAQLAGLIDQRSPWIPLEVNY